MTWTHRVRLFLIGLALSVLLIEAGAALTGPAASACPHCAVLTHPFGCTNAEAVIGGYVCEP